MSILIGEEGLKDLISKNIIENGAENCAEGIKYDFRLSGRFLKAKHQIPADVSDFTVKEKENFSIDPGETVFVLSEEILHLPKEIKAELSHKRKLAHLGILVLGGFCVDPLYEGHLIFGMYNYSNNSFQLQKHAKLIAAQFYRLSEEEITNFPKPASLMDFPDDLRAIAKGMRPISLQGLEQRIEEISSRFARIEDDFQKREEWFKEIQQRFDNLMNLTSRIEMSLEKEITERQTGQDSIQKLFAEQKTIVETLNDSVRMEKVIRKIALWIIGVIITIAVSITAINLSKNYPSDNNMSQKEKVELQDK